MALDQVVDTNRRELWIVLHDHKYGTDTYTVFVTATLGGQPLEQVKAVLAQKLGIDYEPERDDEWLSWYGPYALNDIATLTAADWPGNRELHEDEGG